MMQWIARAQRMRAVAARFALVAACGAMLLAGTSAAAQTTGEQQTQMLAPEVPTSVREAAKDANAPRSKLEAMPLGKPIAIPREGAGQADATVTPSTLGGNAVRTASALLVVLMLLMGCALLVKWMGKKGYLPSSFGGGMLAANQARAVSGLLEVLARYPVAGGSTLVVMKFDKRVLLLHQSRSKGWRGPTEMTTLCELSQPEDVASILLRTRAEEDSKRAAEFEAALRREDDMMGRELAVEPARDLSRETLREAATRRVSEAAKPRARASAASGKAASVQALQSTRVQAQTAPVQQRAARGDGRADSPLPATLGGGRYA